jgi:hypothetical protein
VWARINEASQSPDSVQKLILEVKTYVREYGQALAGSFLADLGGEQFVKTDTHVKGAVSAFLDTEQVDDRRAFEVIRKAAEKHGITPRAIDKIMYLGGSGKWYLLGFQDGLQQRSTKSEFLERLRRAGR